MPPCSLRRLGVWCPCGMGMRRRGSGCTCRRPPQRSTCGRWPPMAGFGPCLLSTSSSWRHQRCSILTDRPPPCCSALWLSWLRLPWPPGHRLRPRRRLVTGAAGGGGPHVPGERHLAAVERARLVVGCGSGRRGPGRASRRWPSKRSERRSSQRDAHRAPGDKPRRQEPWAPAPGRPEYRPRKPPTQPISAGGGASGIV